MKKMNASEGFAPTAFGDSLIAIHRAMAEFGRSRGISIDPHSRIATLSSYGRPQGMELAIDNPSNREKLTFATRLAPVFFRHMAGDLIQYECPVEQSDSTTRFLDAAFRTRLGGNQIALGAEIKICEGTDPSRQIESALGQLDGYAGRLLQSGELPPIFAMSLIVFSKAHLDEASWRSEGYFNCQGGPGAKRPAENGTALLEQCKAKFQRHQMVCLTWIVDVSTEARREEVKSILERGSLFKQTQPTSFTIPCVTELPLAGSGMHVASGGTSLTFGVDGESIGRLPTQNPSGASSMHNTRDYHKDAIELPGNSRSIALIEMVKNWIKSKMSAAAIDEQIAGYAGRQTGANTRRLMAMKDESKWALIEGKGEEPDRLLLISTNVSLSDSQSSTAFFSSMAYALRRSADYDQYVEALREELRFYGVSDSEVASMLKEKLMEGCKTDQERATRFDLFKRLALAAEFDVKVEFPDNQGQATRSSQAANQASPQSSVDLEVAAQRDRMQALHEKVEELESVHGLTNTFRMTKHSQIESGNRMTVSEVVQAWYTGETASPFAYGARGRSGKKLQEMVESGWASALPRADGAWRVTAADENDDEAIWEAGAAAMGCSQALHRCHFEGASDAKRLLTGLNFLQPDRKRIDEFVNPVFEQLNEALDQHGVVVGVERCRQEIDRQIKLINKPRSRLGKTQRDVAGAILRELLVELDMDKDFLEQRTEKDIRDPLERARRRVEGQLKGQIDTDIGLRLGALVNVASEKAIELKAMLGSRVDLSVDAFRRLIYASMQCSWEDGSVGVEAPMGEWIKELSRRAERVTPTLAKKLEQLALATPNGKLTQEALKSLAKTKMEIVSHRGGLLAGGLPSGWASREKGSQEPIYPAYKAAVLWLMSAGLEADGSPAKDAKAFGLKVPRIFLAFA